MLATGISTVGPLTDEYFAFVPAIACRSKQDHFLHRFTPSGQGRCFAALQFASLRISVIPKDPRSIRRSVIPTRRCLFHFSRMCTLFCGQSRDRPGGETLTPSRWVRVALLVVFLGGAWGTSVVLAQYDQRLSVQSPNAESAGGFGNDVARVGDVDGDGRADVVVGAPGETAMQTDSAGRAYVLSTKDGGRLQTLTAPAPDSLGEFGTAVAGVGDINGDEVPEVVVGAPGAHVDETEGVGRVYLFDGATGDTLRTFTSPNAWYNGQFGAAVARVEDRDGDSISDVLIGAPGEPVDGTSSAGRAYLISTGDGAIMTEFTSQSPEEYGTFGTSVAGMGASNGADVDFVVGANGETVNGEEGAGRTYLLRGSDGSIFRTLKSANVDSAGFFGTAVAAVGDIDEGGTNDVVVGAFFEWIGDREKAGRAYVFSGENGDLLQTLEAPEPRGGAFFGSSVAAGGDVNEDGVPDILVGAFGDLVDGYPRAGRIHFFDGADGGGIQSLQSPNPQNDGFFGGAVHAGALLLGDEPGDVIVGAHEEDGSTTSAGRAYVFGRQPAAPTGLTVTATADSVTLDWDPVDLDELTEYHVYRDVDPIDTTVSPSTLETYETTAASETRYTDPEVESGQTYYYRVTAANGNVQSHYSKEASAFHYPEEVVVDIQQSFDDPGAGGHFRLVALPGADAPSLSDVMEGTPGLDWTAYWDDGSKNDFFQVYDGSETFTLAPGRGFWVSSTDEVTVQDRVSTVPLDGDAGTTIDVHSGWNIISNPLDKDVSWEAVERATGGTLQPLWRFDGTFVEASTFRSASEGEAYYYFHDRAVDSLTIPYPDAPGSEETSGKRVVATDRSTGALELRATSVGGTVPATSIRVGIADDAEVGLDERDVIAPPAPFEHRSLHLVAPTDAPERVDRLAAEYRPPSDESEGQTFGLRLTGADKRPVRLAAAFDDAFGRQALILDPVKGTSYDLRSGTVRLEPTAETTELRLAVGSATFVARQAEAVVPDDLSLTVYPNPVRTQGTLKYSLPDARQVDLRLYDVLGREVARLVRARKQAGRYTVSFDTDRLSSGLYVARLEAEGTTRLQKITVVQ